MAQDVNDYDLGWEGIFTTSDERKKMSPEKLAILLSKQKEGTPAYILLSHELDMRIANVQSKAQYTGAAIGFVGIIAGALLTVWLQSHYTDSNRCDRPCEQYKQGPISQPKPPMPLTSITGSKSVDIKTGNKTNQKR